MVAAIILLAGCSVGKPPAKDGAYPTSATPTAPATAPLSAPDLEASLNEIGTLDDTALADEESDANLINNDSETLNSFGQSYDETQL